MKQKRTIAQKTYALFLAAVLVLSSIMVSPSTVRAAGWLEYATQTITLGTAVSGSIKNGDYYGLTEALSNSGARNTYWHIYKFAMPKDGLLNLYIESASSQYLTYGTWRGLHEYDGFVIYSTSEPDTIVWRSKCDQNEIEKQFSASRAMYYGSTEIALNQGEYYFAIRQYETNDTPYYLTLSYKEPVINVNSISLSTSSLTMEIGEQKTIIPTIFPNNATDKTVVWKSENPSIATVENGMVKAVSIGTTSISATSADGEIKAVCPVTVGCNHNYKSTISPAGINYSGYILKTCTKCGAETKDWIAAIDSIKLSETSYRYDGKEHKPSVTVLDNDGKALESGRDYIISYTGNQKDVGIHTVTVKFKGNYSGSLSKQFTIYPESTMITKVKSKKKGFTVSWKKQRTQTTGYELAYSTSHSFRSNKTTIITVSRNKAKKAISKLKKRKHYYVRIRTYKNVTVNGQNTRLYSRWSVAKKITTKK